MAEIPSEPHAFVVLDGDLNEEWSERYAGATALAVDTEAMGLIHGRDRLCLVQICDDKDQVACIRIALGQTEAPRLKALMEATTIAKVFHFARFDVAALATGLGIRVNPLFCTKVGSRLARTYTPRHGLKDLVMELVGVELDKQAQSSDWGRVDELTDVQKNLKKRKLDESKGKVCKIGFWLKEKEREVVEKVEKDSNHRNYYNEEDIRFQEMGVEMHNLRSNYVVEFFDILEFMYNA